MPVRPEDFGGVPVGSTAGAGAVRPEDFGGVPVGGGAAPAADPTFGDKLGAIGTKIGQGLAAGGPMGAFGAAVGTGLHTIDEATQAAGYKAGDVVSGLGTKAGLSPEVAAGAGLAANVGVQAIPAVAGGSLGGKVASAAKGPMERIAKWLMTSALKPDKVARETGTGARAVQTLLDEGANVTESGVTKLRGEIDDLNKQIKAAIQNSTATVDKKAVADTLDQALDKFRKQVTPQSDVATIEKAKADFLAHPLLNGQGQIPVQLAQELKQGTYRALGSKSYGELKGADTEAQKGLARGLKEQIAQAVPGIDKLNKRESELLNAETLAAARVLLDANKNPLGLGWLAKDPMGALGFIIDRSPTMKSLIARAAYSGREAIPRGIGTAAGAATPAALSAIDPQASKPWNLGQP